MSTLNSVNLNNDLQADSRRVEKIKTPAKLEEGVFNRIEDKYIVGHDHKDGLRELLTSLAAPSYPSASTEYTLIESLYFDSPNFIFFQHHFDKTLDQRFKLRVRRYGPNGEWDNDTILLEVKRKRLNVCKKTRIRISNSILDELKRGLPVRLTEELVQLNEKLALETLSKRVMKINMLIFEYKLKPMIRVRYLRHAYIRDNVRITVDSEVTPRLVGSPDFYSTADFRMRPFWLSVNNLMEKYNKNSSEILEIKHTGKVPGWLEKFLVDTNTVRTSFSKYCFSTGTLITQALQGGYVNNENINHADPIVLH